jgi:hypothetical protein
MRIKGVGLSQLDGCYQKDESVVSRDIAGEVILVPIRQNVGDLESIYTLNETAAFIWALLDGKRTVGDIRDHVVAEFEIDKVEAEADLRELLAQLEAIGAVRKA